MNRAGGRGRPNRRLPSGALAESLQVWLDQVDRTRRQTALIGIQRVAQASGLLVTTPQPARLPQRPLRAA